MIEREARLTLIGSKKFVIAPSPPADLIGAVQLSIKPGGLREDSIDVPGQDGIARTVLGYADAEITAEIRIWDAGQLQNIKRLADIFRPKREQKLFQPVQIISPAAERWGIRTAYIFAIKESSWTARSGLVITLEMREWQPKARRKTQSPKLISATSGDYSFLSGTDISAPSKGGAPKP